MKKWGWGFCAFVMIVGLGLTGCRMASVNSLDNEYGGSSSSGSGGSSGGYSGGGGGGSGGGYTGGGSGIPTTPPPPTNPSPPSYPGYPGYPSNPPAKMVDITVNYTDNTTTEDVVSNTADNKIPFTKTGLTIKSVECNGKTHLVGRATSSGDLFMKFDDNGNLLFRNYESGDIPIGSYAEFQLIGENYWDYGGGQTSYGKSFKQEADLDLMNEEWKPIANSDDQAWFVGDFNGDGKKIENLKIDKGSEDYKGLFMRTYATIQDVHIESGTITANECAGSICAWNEGTIKNCSSAADVSGNRWIGGVAGYNWNSDGSGGVIDNCSNTGTVTGTGDRVGGITGVNDEDSTITDCRNDGDVEGDTYVGGVAGNNWKGDIKNCHNSGNVTGGNSGIGRVGGVAGANLANSTITDCSNSGEVKGTEHVGGLTGHHYESAIENCSNTGNVTATGDGMAGGVVGNTWNSTITACSNTGNVRGAGSIGGVVASVTGDTPGSIVTACSNTGNVTGYFYVGGVAGVVPAGAVIGCYNSGFVTGLTDNSGPGRYSIGGVAGESHGSITACYNSGEVSAANSTAVGGVAGANYNPSTITACYNTRNVTGLFNVGGVAGTNSGGTITACYNTGAVSGSSPVGGVVGYNSNSTITACYWVTGNASNGIGNPSGNTNATPFSGTDWPGVSGGAAGWDNPAWGWSATANGSGNGQYWKSLGTASSSPGVNDFPKLWFEP